MHKKEKEKKNKRPEMNLTFRSLARLNDESFLGLALEFASKEWLPWSNGPKKMMNNGHKC